ncbi:MAG: glycosyltransferase [Candidatus Diapherotrites archaeon]|uniref:Glycosyltransferase n=1 Tax=Candidatus Iainarchaeum sp. TaxID=3101447 RepID=A0A939C6Z4_9ARCH|nr:glycosyltransferase [Candidatus Diapherotrites archaeon]
MKKTLSVIVPAFNEEARIKPFLEQLLSFKQRNSFVAEVIVVDDGSTDSTLSILQGFGNRLKVISYRPNKGKGHAVKTGILAARSALVCFMDADGATPASQLTDMYNALQGNDVVVGNRKTERARIIARQPLYRRFLSWGFNTSVQILFNFNVKDLLCGFKGMRTDLGKEIAAKMVSNRWIFDVELIARANALGASFGVIPIEWSHVKGSKMKIGLNTVSMFLKLVKLRIDLAREK